VFQVRYQISYPYLLLMAMQDVVYFHVETLAACSFS
jgi:hypothetical protein